MERLHFRPLWLSDCLEYVSRSGNSAPHYFLNSLLRPLFLQRSTAIRDKLIQLKHNYFPALAAAAASARRAASLSCKPLIRFFAAGFDVSFSRCERNSRSTWSFLACAI